MNKNAINNSFTSVGGQELRSSSNLIFHQVEKDGVVDREVIPIEHERV